MDVLLRIGVALAAGAMFRMLVVFGLPAMISIVGLAIAGAALSHKLVASRVFVVLSLSFGHFLTYLMTRNAGAADATDNPSGFLLAANATVIFLPLAMPALGSMLLMQYEKKQAQLAAETKELTEESLLAEALPASPANTVELDYEKILATATDPEESSPSPTRAAGSSDSVLPSRG